MIQKISARQPNHQIAPHKPNLVLDEWGKWHNHHYYQMEVIQHPIRARMCGFGDKDRRPLAPAAVVKLVVKKEDNTLLDPDVIDCSFFVVTVDLWSSDGAEERNLVLHPNCPAAVRFNPGTANAAAEVARRRASSQSTPSPQSRDAFNSQFRPPDQQQASYSQGQPPTWGYPAPPSNPSTNHLDRTTGYPPPSLPSINSFPTWSRENVSDAQSRQWNQDIQFHNQSASSPSFQVPSHDTQPIYNLNHLDNAYSQNASPSSSQSPFPSYSTRGSAAPPSTTHHIYTRTLVGPLSCNATRLLDEHRKPGIFFLFQDLSVRTEGIFRLRLRLMNVGAPPAPEAGATNINNGYSPILAQAFTQPFTVFSAKRFPGVPDTTALSIALGNQGQKLPLRNRHGSKRRRRNNSDEEDDSDGS